MKRLFSIPKIILLLLLTAGVLSAQTNGALADNAALRYWSAFSVLQDVALTTQQAKELTAILDGTAPYDDSKYKDLLEKNALALEIMARGASLPKCDWGLDYSLGPELPAEYSRKALALGRLNVLYSLHLFKTGNKNAGVRALVSGLQFSRDSANGGTLFATILAKELLIDHLRAIGGILHLENLSAAQKMQLAKAVDKLGVHGVDWQSAIKREMQLLNRPPWQANVPLAQVTKAYVAAFQDTSQLSNLQQVLTTVPQPLREVIPGPTEIIPQQTELDQHLAQIRSLLQ